MRYLFIILLLANIAFFVWAQRLSPQAKSTFKAVDEGVTKLQLISEAELHKSSNNETQNNVSNQINGDIQQLCYSAGPFDVEANVHAAQETLDPLVLKTNIRKITTTQEAVNWQPPLLKIIMW